MNQEKFTFELVDKYTPDIVIKNLLGQIEEATRGYVIGNIEKYDGPILSYTKKRESKGVFAALQGTEEYKSRYSDKIGRTRFWAEQIRSLSYCKRIRIL